MKISITNTLALGGLCVLFAGAAGAASAQGYGGPGMHHGAAHARRHIQGLKAAYAHDVANGHYAAAHRAHLQARAIRQRVRTHREMAHADMGRYDMNHRDMHRDHGF